MISWLRTYIHDGGVTDAALNSTLDEAVLYHAYKWDRRKGANQTADEHEAPLFAKMLRRQAQRSKE